MSDDLDEVIESKATAEEQKEAASAGWIPPERAKALNGKPFIDADEFLARRREILPVVKAENARLRAQVEALTANQTVLTETINKAQAAIDAIEMESSVKTAKAVEAAKKEVQTALATALEAGDHAAVAALTMQASELAAVDTEVKEPVKRATPVQLPQNDPTFLAWRDDNPWFDVDKRKTRLALVISQELIAGGETLRNRPFLDKVTKMVEEETAPPKERDEPESKVDGGRHSDGARTRKTGYDSLSADARKQCDADSSGKFGAGKRYADAAAFRAAWVNAYNEN